MRREDRFDDSAQRWDTAGFMLLGEVIEHARTEDLFLTPRDPRTADYVEGRYG